MSDEDEEDTPPPTMEKNHELDESSDDETPARGVKKMDDQDVEALRTILMKEHVKR
jgi:hypothetical protein